MLTSKCCPCSQASVSVHSVVRGSNSLLKNALLLLLLFVLLLLSLDWPLGTEQEHEQDKDTVDLTPLPAVGVGAEVTLWGEGPAGTRLSIDEVAASAGTVGYELMCALAPRVPTRAV